MLQTALVREEKNDNNNNRAATQIATLDVTGMKCAGCVKAVERQLIQNNGVISARVNLITEVAVIEYQEGAIEPENIAQKLSSKGFPSQIRTADSDEEDFPAAKRRQKENQEQLKKLIVAIVLLFFSALGHIEHIGGPSIPILNNIWFHANLATVALIFPARSIIIDGARSLWHKMPNMNTLVSLGTLSAYLASCIALFFPQLGWECFFDEPVMLLGFVILGRTLEGRARSKATNALESLIALKPVTARLIGKPSIDQESGIEIPVKQIRVGEWVKVLPGEKIPVDGIIVDGITAIDESSITGESIPVAKKIGDPVTAGTIDQSGPIAVLVTRTGKDTTLARIVASVEDAQTHKAPVQQLADTVAGYFAYGVIGIAIVTFLFWYFAGTQIWPEVLTAASTHSGDPTMIMATSPLLLSLKVAIAVLVVACPCALGLATPTAILVGTGVGAEHGLSIRGGDILETIHKLNTIVFDKTGTLTVGKPEITDCIPFQDLDADSLLQIAAAVEVGTNHPLAKAIVTAAKQKNLVLPETSGFHTTPGLGASAIVAGKEISLGNAEWIGKKGIAIDPKIQDLADALAREGKTIVYAAREIELIGLIALQDILRPDASETVKTLQQMGLEVVLLSGDRQIVTEAIASKLGIEKYFAAVKPEGKAAIIQSLQQNNQQVVAMVGDGINDAPALATADIGISLHHSTDVARDTAGIVLMREKLTDVVKSIQLSQATFNKIRQNLIWALGYNTFAIPVAAGVLLPSFGILLSPVVAAALMASSSIFVVTNSLLLRRQFD